MSFIYFSGYSFLILIRNLKQTLCAPMAMLIRWQFDCCDFIPPEGFDKWWTDTHIDGQVQCEEALSYNGKGGSCIVVKDKEEYRVDLVRMVQQNLKTGRTRPIRRTIVRDFSIATHYFENGKMRKRRPADRLAEPKHQKPRKSLE